MIGTVYDYLMATIIFGVIFVGAVVVVPNASYMNLFYVDQQQLRNVALETLKAILLDTGYPVNWGSQTPFDQGSIQRFGLAHSGTSSFYVLDPEKVQRLVADNPAGNVDYEVIREKLRLQGYDFRIRVMPPFKVEVDASNQTDDFLFNIFVASNEGRPIPNALVEATLFYVSEISGQKKNPYFVDSSLRAYTDELGECTISYEFPSDCRGYILLLKVSVADISTIVVPYLKGISQNVAAVSLIGDHMMVHIPETASPPAERRIHNISCVTEDGIWNIYDGVDPTPSTDNKMNSGAGSFQYWYRTFLGLSYENPLFLIFNIRTTVKHEGRQLVLFAVSPLINIQSGLLQFGSLSAPSSGGAVKLSRSVDIGGMTYIFELLLWKKL